MARQVKYPKPKLPRKRKKKAIKAQGRRWYHDTILLHKILQRKGELEERRCKFWKNDSIVPMIRVVAGVPRLVKGALKFW